MTRKIRRLLWLIVIVISSSLWVAAQNGGIPPVAAVTGGQLTLYGLNGGAQTVAGGWIVNPVWSPDGQKLAFTVIDSNPSLMLTDRGGSAPVTLAENVSLLPATFTADSAQIIYAVEGSPDEITTDGGTPAVPVRIYVQNLNPGAEPSLIGEIRFGVGCGGGSPFPMDAIYNTEAGFGGRALTFVRTDFGVLHSTNCAGIGLALMDIGTGESVQLSGDASRAALSPNRAQFAAIRDGSVVVVNLATGGIQFISTQASPDQITWRDDGALFYSTRHLIDSALPLSAEEAQALADRYGLAADGVPQYSVSIYRLNLSGGETQVYRGPGWAIGRLFVSGGALYFSLVPNGEAWVEALVNGGSEWGAVAVTLFRLNGDGSASEIGTDIGQATPHPSA